MARAKNMALQRTVEVMDLYIFTNKLYRLKLSKSSAGVSEENFRLIVMIETDSKVF